MNAQEVFVFNESNSPLVPEDLRCISVDSSNSIWIGSRSSLYSFKNNWSRQDTELELSEPYEISFISISPNGTIYTAIKNTNLYIQYKLFYKNHTSWDTLKYDFQLRDPWSISIKNDSTLFLTLVNFWNQQLGNDAVGIYTANEMTIIDPEYIYGINSAVPLSGDSLLIVDWEGIHLFNGSDWQLQNPDDWIPIKINKIENQFYVWGERLSKYVNNEYQIYQLVDSLLIADSLLVTSLAVEEEENLWIGTNSGLLINYSNNEVKTYNFTYTSILDIAIDRDKNKWAISKEGCFLFNENKIVNVRDNTTNPNGFKLYYNYPNPFNPTTKIKYTLANGARTTVHVYDLLGRKIKTLVDKYQNAGSYEIEFNANNLASGIYFYNINSGEFTDTKKMLLIR
ncbi:T9SS type A sorting domain-containing protein [Bacteroidota bacterium]